LKSNVSDHIRVMELVYKDASMKCIADVSDLRDLETIRSRVKHGGISFLTITLPDFCKSFERSLASGYIDTSSFPNFRRVKGGSIPCFLQGMIGRLFDRETGRMFDHEMEPPFGGDSSDFPTIIESVRQICLTFKKLELDCTPKRVSAALENFTSIERSFEKFSIPDEDTAKFLAVSSCLWGTMVADFSSAACIPRHGPGATADKRSGNRKYRWLRWHDRLEPYFPLVDNGYPLGTPVDSRELEMVSIVPEDEEQPVKVVTVPKTLKSPRIIAIEPCCMQYVQQGIRDYLYDKIESHWLSRGHVNFRDQSINQQLAIDASKTGRYATIDLSDASDRVPLSLAQEMFRSSPELWESIDSCRSRAAQLPGGDVISPLRKFASMGSALCFPIEAMYFYTICVVALLEFQNLPITLDNCFKVSRELYVYGDDIVVPTNAAVTVLDHLQKYNCKVNLNKTFVSGSFRESCGVDAYCGYEVTPTYLHHERPENRRQASQIISWVATANLFYLKGYWSTSQFMLDCIKRIVGYIPCVSETSEALGRISFLGCCHSTAHKNVRWNKQLQRLEIRAWVPAPVYRTDELEGYGALTKCFLGLLAASETETSSSQGGSQLEQSALFGAVTLIRRWVPPH